MKRRMQSGGRVVVLGALLALAAVIIAATSAQASTSSPLKVAYSGIAWGASVTGGNTAHLQPAFRATLTTCAAKPGSVSRNTGASAHVPNALQTGTIANRVSASGNASIATTRSTSTIHSTNVLKGLIRASLISTRARVSYLAGKGFRFGGGARYGGLAVNGQSVSVHPNTRISLPGIGRVILNQQKRTVRHGTASIVVNAIHVVVTNSANPLGLRTGTNIVVGHAAASLRRPMGSGPVSGYAYGTHVRIGNAAQSGYSARLAMACLGGSKTVRVVGVKSAKLASSGTIQSRTASRVRGTTSSGTASNTIQNVSLANGTVRADVVRAKVHGSLTGSKHRFSDTSSLVGLVVNGTHVSAKTNQRLQVKGVGTLWVHRVVRTRRGITVRMLELIAGAGNTLGLKTGTHVEVGVARVRFVY